MWLKTENFSNACGTSTLKSPLLRAFFTPHVYPRLRKRLSRCTLDCGFKTPESPALRGFVAERCPTTGTSLYLVLLSNGLHCPKIRLKKFGFSPKTIPTNIAKKLPPQRCSKPFLIPIFNFSHKWPTFAFTPKAGTHSAFGERSHTTAHTAKHGAFRMGVVSLPSDRSERSRIFPGRVSERRTLPLLGLGRGCSRRTQRACGTAMRLCASLFRGVAAPLGCVICLQLGDVAVSSLCAQYFLIVRGGGGITTLGAFHTFWKPCAAGCQNGELCRFWALVGCAPEERRKPSGQRYAYACRCSEASQPRWAAYIFGKLG